MSNRTPNYNLEKPTPEEFYDIEVQNSNMDKIDTVLKTLSDEVANGVTEEDIIVINGKLDDIDQGVDELNTKSDLIKQGVDDANTKLNAGIGKVLRSVTFTANGTFTVSAGVTEVYITGGGAGGGGGASTGSSGIGANGSAGGITSFGALLSLNGGGGGGGSAGIIAYAFGGAAGGPGGQSGQGPYNSYTNHFFGVGNGGNSGPYHGGYGAVDALSQSSKNGGYCAGGGGGTAHVNNTSVAGGGGGGHFVYDHKVTVTPLTSIPITIGIGGNGGTAGNCVGGKGGNGILTVKWWE